MLNYKCTINDNREVGGIPQNQIRGGHNYRVGSERGRVWC